MTARQQALRVGTSAALALSTLVAVSSEIKAQGPVAVPAKQEAQAKPAALVNGEPVALADVDAFLAKLPPPPQPLTEAQRRQIRMEVLARMIDDVLIRQFLNESKVVVTPVEVEKEIAGIVEQLKAQTKTLQDFCKETGQSEAQLRRDIANMTQWGNYLKPLLTEAAIRTYYDENKDFFDQVTIRASHIMLGIVPEASPSDRQAALTKLTSIRQDIVAGKLSFSDAVAKYSESPNKANGGDLGFFPRKMVMVEALAKPAFTLKVGDLSDVIETETGAHIIQVTDRKPGSPSSLDKIKDDVRELYVAEIREGVLAKQRKTCKVEVNLP